MSKRDKRILVLSVDKDNDVGRVTGASTPIIGRDKVSSIATLFAIRSPEDSDTNSIFAAINTYDSLVEEGITCEIAVLAGSEEGGFKGDLKIAAELDYVLKNFKADGAVFVSDGASDEQLIPAIQSKIPIISVKRVFVQQQKSVEETYVLLYRYIKKLGEPEYSKIALGVPGIIILATIALYFANLLNYAVLSLGIIVSVVLIVKGFKVDSSIKSAWSESPIRLITTIIGLIIAIVAVYRGLSLAILGAPLPDEVAKFVSLVLENMIDLLVIGVVIFLAGKMVVKYLEESPKLWHEIVALVALVFIRQIVLDAAIIVANPTANLIPFILTAAIGAGVCAVLVIIFTLTPRFKKTRSTASSKKQTG